VLCKEAGVEEEEEEYKAEEVEVEEIIDVQEEVMSFRSRSSGTRGSKEAGEVLLNSTV